MKAKRILATIMSVVLLATSGNFTMDAHATQDGTDANPVVVEDGDDVPGVTLPGDEELPGADVGDGSDSLLDNADFADERKGTNDGSDEKIVPEWGNEYFDVTESGFLREKADKPVSSLSGTVTLPDKAKKIPAGIFNNNTRIIGLTISVNSELAVINEGAFKGSGIRSLNIPDAVTEIPKEAFKNSKLSNISFSATSKLTTIGEEAFFGSSLVKIDIPVLVTRIDESAFGNCASMTNVALHNVETIGNGAFRNCTQLASIGWGEKLREIGDFAFSGIGIKTIELNNKSGASITTWGTSVFENCTYLATVRLHMNMAVIPAGMFKNCTKLTTIEIPRDCTVIRKEAFFNSGLKKITVTDRVNAIETGAFADCQNLTEVTINQKGSNSAGESDIVIATDAFNQKTMTLKGYDGTVQDYANEKGYTFKTLFPSHKITIKPSNYADKGDVVLSKKTAIAGEIIEVKVTPKEGQRLRAYGFTYNGEEITTLKEEVTTGTASRTFTFEMPDEDVELYVPFESTTTSYSALRTSFEQTDSQMPFDWDSKGKLLTFDKTGMSCRLVIEGKKASTYYELGAWAFTYSSSKTTVATVDAKGVVYARGKGSSTITATMKDDTSKKITFKVQVDQESNIDYDNIQLEYTDLNRAKVTSESFDGEDITVVSYTKSNLSTEEQHFTVNLKATEVNDTRNLYVRSEWKSANEELAYVEKEVVSNNSNVIRVKQGVVGETSVTVSVTNGKTGKSKVTYYEESIIIRVIDVTPRLVQSTLTVNSNCDPGTGMAFDLLSVYGYEVDLTSLTVGEFVSNKKVEDPVPLDYVSIGLRDGRPFIELTQEGRNYLDGRSSKTYSKAYIQGDYVYQADNGAYVTEQFRVPIKSLVLTTKVLKPTIKLSGKINLFFNHLADASDRGEVTITQNQKTLKVETYKLVSEANYKSPGSEPIDSLANNFDVDANGVISRSANELIKDAKNKVVTKGYLQIKYEGYAPCYVKITVPTQNTKPGYVLSKTKATVNAYSKYYEMELQLLNKKTKKPISLEHLNTLSFDESSAGTTMGLFEDLDTAAARATDKIVLKIKSAQKGKAVVNVEMDTWNEPMKFTFNLSVNSSAPKAKLKKTTLTLNNLCVGKEESTDVSLNQADVTILDMENIRFVGKPALSQDADNIHINYSDTDKKLTVFAGAVVQAGSYKFSMTPHVQYTDGTQENVKDVTVTVKVIDKKLTASLKSATVTLNNRYVGRETAVTSYTIKNMPSGNGAVSILSQGVVIEGTNAAAQEARNSFVFTFDEDATRIRVQQTNTVRKTGSYKYKISGLKTVVEGAEVDAEVEIQPFTLSVKVINSTAKLTVKASGSVNPISGSGIVYTLKAGNTSARIVDVDVRELNKINGKNNLIPLTNFELGEIKRDENDNIVSVEILAKENWVLDSGTHKLRIGIILEGADDGEATWSKDLSIKPKQTLPKIKTNVTSTTLYAGVAANSPMRSQEIQITKTTEKTAVMNNVVLSDSNPDNVKKAFRVTSFDPHTQTAKVTLVRPDLLIANTEYSLKLEARYENQMNKTKGSQFTLNVKLLN